MSYLHKEGLFSFDPVDGAQDLTLMVQNIAALDDGDSLHDAYDFARTSKEYFWTEMGVPLSYSTSELTFHTAAGSLELLIPGAGGDIAWADIEIRYKPEGSAVHTQVFISGWDGAAFGSNGFFREVSEYNDTGKVAWTKKKVGVVRNGHYPLFATQAEAEEYSPGIAQSVLQEDGYTWWLPASDNLVEYKDWFHGTFNLFYSAHFEKMSGTAENPEFSYSENYVNDSVTYLPFTNTNGKYGEILNSTSEYAIKTYFDSSDGDASFSVSPEVSGENVFTRHGTNSMTVSLWFKADSDNSHGVIMSMVGADPSQDFLFLRYNVSGEINITRNIGGGPLHIDLTSGPGEVVAGRWYHLALTIDPHKVQLYKNGSILLTKDFSGTYTPSFVPDNIIFCKSHADDNNNLVGGMDHVQLWSRTLSHSEVNYLRNTQSFNYISIDLPEGRADDSELQPGDTLGALTGFWHGDSLEYFAFEVQMDGYWQPVSGGYLSSQSPVDFTPSPFSVPWAASGRNMQIKAMIDGQWLSTNTISIPDFTSFLSPVSYMGHYPLYSSGEEASLASGAQMSYHTHDFIDEYGSSVTYYMPEGLTMGVDQFHGDYGIYAKMGFEETLDDDSLNGFQSSTPDSAASFSSADGRLALALDGSSRYAYPSINLYDAGDPSKPLTMSFWIKPPTGFNAEGDVVFGTRRSDQNGGFSFQKGVDNQYYFVSQKSDGSSTVGLGGIPLPYDQWSHVTIVVQPGGTALRYLDGVYIGDVDLGSGFPMDNHSTFTIGGLSTSDEANWQGEFDDFRIWTDKEMVANEVQYHYQQSIVTTPVTVSGDPVDISMQDSYGDGWNGNNLYVFNVDSTGEKTSVAAGPITLGYNLSSGNETINLEMYEVDGVTPKQYKWELLYNVTSENAVTAVLDAGSNSGFPYEITFSATDQDGDLLFFRNNNSEWGGYFYLADVSVPELTVAYDDGASFSEYVVSVSANTEALDQGVTSWALNSESMGNVNDVVNPSYATSLLSETMSVTIPSNGTSNYYIVGIDSSGVIKATSSLSITVSHFPEAEFSGSVYAEGTAYLNVQNPMGFTLTSASLMYYDHFAGETFDDAVLIETFSTYIPSSIVPPAAASGKAIVLLAEWAIPNWNTGSYSVSDQTIVVDAYGSVTSRLPLLADADDIVGSYSATEINNFDTFSTSYFSGSGYSGERPVLDLFADGSSYASIPGGVIDTNNNFAISFWYKSNYDGSNSIPNTGGDDHKHYIFSNKGADVEGLEIYFDASPQDEANYQYDYGRLVVKITAPDGTVTHINGSENLSSSYNQGQWHNYKVVGVMTEGQRSIAIYRNGSFDAYGTPPFGIRSSTNNFRIGKPDGSGLGAEGYLADIMFWNGSTGYNQHGAYQIVSGGPYTPPDVTPPVIDVFSTEVSANVGDDWWQAENAVYSNFNITDDSGGYTTQITPTMSTLDMSSAGSYSVTVTAIDMAGNQSVESFTLNIVEGEGEGEGGEQTPTDGFGAFQFSGAVRTGNEYLIPSSAQSWAGFANLDTSMYPISFPHGGEIKFEAFSAGSVELRFKFEANPYPNTEPSFYTESITVSGAPQEYTIQIPAQGSDTYNSFLLYLITLDQVVVVENLSVTEFADPNSGGGGGSPAATNSVVFGGSLSTNPAYLDEWPNVADITLSIDNPDGSGTLWMLQGYNPTTAEYETLIAPQNMDENLTSETVYISELLLGPANWALYSWVEFTVMHPTELYWTSTLQVGNNPGEGDGGEGEGEGGVGDHGGWPISVEDGDKVMIFADGELLHPSQYSIANGMITFAPELPAGTVITGVKSK